MIKEISKKFISMYFYRILSIFPFKNKASHRKKSDSIRNALYMGLGVENINFCSDNPTAAINFRNDNVCSQSIFLKKDEWPSFSIVINTYNRINTLKETLESLKYIRYPGDFEVIVVNGPSNDGTSEYLSSLKEMYKIGYCDEVNLSKSRNIGIAMSKGDIVVFIDDDAVPESDWLFDLSLCFKNDVACAGGRVYDKTGYYFQSNYIYSNRLGNSFSQIIPFNEPYGAGSFSFPLCIGTNCAFVRKLLIDVGGFDEEIEYFLDENDVITRLVDSGYKISQTDNAFVHHKFYKSHLRDSNKVIKNYYPIIKNKLYYSLQYITCKNSAITIVKNVQNDVNSAKKAIEKSLKENKVPIQEVQDVLKKFNDQISSAFDRAFNIFYSGQPKKLIKKELLDKYSSLLFKKFNPVILSNPLNIVLVFRYYLKPGGIATVFKSLADNLVKKGHMVHVICQNFDSSDNKVYFKDGIWVHALKVNPSPRAQTINNLLIPNYIWDWSFTAYTECIKIDRHHHISIVESTEWDAESLAFLVEKRWTVVTLLVTPMLVWLDNNMFMVKNKKWYKQHCLPLIEAEKYVMLNSDAIKADSVDIVQTIQDKYKITLPVNKTTVVPLGIDELDNETLKSVNANLKSDIVVLFVGRLEKRKGIDTLLEVIPKIANKFSNVIFEIVGNFSITEDTLNYKDDFIEKFKNNQSILDRVRFRGEISDTERDNFYRDSDIFVAPSRYESFGLIYLEAMQFSKPVIGCNRGGPKEIIIDGKNGYLIPPDSPLDLEQKLSKLIEDKNLRISMGENGYRLFKERFTSSIMTTKTLDLYNKLKAKNNCLL